jgi:hypothetical protein
MSGLARINVQDLVGLSSRQITDEGYLIAPAVLARAGNVQPYSASELGLKDRPPSQIVRLYRPLEEVGAADSVPTFEGKPITFRHPPGLLTARNWKKFAVGDVHEVKVEGGEMRGTVIIRDADAVRAVLDGTSALSNGYSFEFDPTPGTTAAGAAYDAVMRKLRGNHTAITPVARGGATCRIADQSTTEEKPMSTRTIVIDGISVELETLQASLVEKIVGDAKKAEKTALDASAAAEKRATDAEAALKTATDAATKATADHAAKVTELEGKMLKPEQIEQLVVERVKVIGDAAKLRPEYKPEGKTVAQIRAEVLTEVLANDEALKPIITAGLHGVEPAKADAGKVETAFATAIAAKGTVIADAAAADAATRNVTKILAGNGNPPANAQDAKPIGRQAFKANLKGASASQESTAE